MMSQLFGNQVRKLLILFTYQIDKRNFTKNCQKIGVNSQNHIKCSTKAKILNQQRNQTFKNVGKPILPPKNFGILFQQEMSIKKSKIEHSNYKRSLNL
ncbi:unnamed protein product [Paramecium octaurelia]|uniref:Uncharacterized protein n=1 Tax=Paramecium octaurelia TaxID=43137 RepID=A0A8S1TRU7_PAROT|nr:unnamed protein product [Paramecium octaurelia]